MVALSPHGQNVVTAFHELPESEKRVLVEELNKDTYPRGDKYRTQIWQLLLGGLFVVALAAIIAAVILNVKNKDGTAVVALASAVVAGVIGLFANPPTS
jgi:lipopolysaccharide export LptBFGC system permease protein LptF